jgi:hypothetical protein
MAKEAPPQRSKDIVDRGTIEHEQALPRSRAGPICSGVLGSDGTVARAG